MITPERRTRGDLYTTAAIAMVISLIAGVMWWNSSSRTTISNPAISAAPHHIAASRVPTSLHQLWSAPSSHTLVPLVVSGTVVTGEANTVTGYDPTTGQPRWTFARQQQLCAVSYSYAFIVAVYPDSRGCGQVSSINSITGQRGPTRTAYADDHVIVTSDGSTVLSAGPTRLELWRSDLIRMLSYGEIDARVKPSHTAIGQGCAMMSADASAVLVSVLQACPDTNTLTLRLLTPGEEEDEPIINTVLLTGVRADSDARILAVSDTHTAVYLPTPHPNVTVYDHTGTALSSTALSRQPIMAASRQAVTRIGDLLYTWWTGDTVEVFDTELTYRYTIKAAGTATPVGPATMMAGMLLIPLTSGIGVYNRDTGIIEDIVSMTHPEGRGPVVPAVIGSMVVEQHGDTVAVFSSSEQ